MRLSTNRVFISRAEPACGPIFAKTFCMTPSKSIPPHLRRRVLTERSLENTDLTRFRFRASDMTRLRPGMYTTDPDAVSSVDIATELARGLDDVVVYGVSAAQWHGLRLPTRLLHAPRVHLASTGGKDRIRRVMVKGAKASFLPGEVAEYDGVRITTPERTFFDLARMVSPMELVAIGDGIVCSHRFGIYAGRPPMSTIPQIEALLSAHRRARGVALARRALCRVRVGSDSVMETRMRLIAEDYGIEGWDLDVAVEVDGRLVQPDLRHRRSGLFVQYEGAHHNESSQVERDIERLRRTERAGHRELRIYAKDLVTVDRFGRNTTPRLIPLLRQAIDQALRGRVG